MFRLIKEHMISLKFLVSLPSDLMRLVSFGYDPNRTNLPIGGFIVSIGSTEGGGYQPLIGDGGTVTVSAGGSITSVSIGNSGSGYRTGVGTIFVGVQTSSIGTPNITTIGNTISNGNVTGVTITNWYRIHRNRSS